MLGDASKGIPRMIGVVNGVFTPGEGKVRIGKGIPFLGREEIWHGYVTGRWSNRGLVASIPGEV